MTDLRTRPDRIDQQLLHRHRRLRDLKARAELLRRHTPMMRSLARHHTDGTVALEAAARAGSRALVEAIETYDPACGEPFDAFAAAVVLARVSQSSVGGPMVPWAADGPSRAPSPRRDQDPTYVPATPA